MEFIILALSIYGAYILWRGFSKGGLLNIQIPFVTNRGLLAVRAAWYLILFEDDATEEEANTAVKNMDENMPTDMTLTAKDFINSCYEGRQLPMIAEARKKGFLG